MHFSVLTLFPEYLTPVLTSGVSARAKARGLYTCDVLNPRDWTTDVHRTVDDRPFGGGPGMVMLAEPLANAVDSIEAQKGRHRRISFAPSGTPFTDKTVERLLGEERLLFVCGRYEGIDQRFLDTYIDEVISLGDFVLSGAELACACVMDAIIRQIPGAIKTESFEEESFKTGLLDFPHYSRPEVWRDQPVPEVLLSGHHANINAWRREKSLLHTLHNRPDLIKIADSSNLLSKADRRFLLQHGWTFDE